MAKINLKKKASAVAKRAKSVAKKGKLDVMEIAKANAGGFAAAFLVDKLDNQDFIANMEGDAQPFAAPLIVEAGGIMLQMFGGPQMQSVAYGMMGGAAALSYQPLMDIKDTPANGTNTTNGTNTINATREKKKMFQNIIDKMARGEGRKGGHKMSFTPRINTVANANNKMGVKESQHAEQRMNSNANWRQFSTSSDC